MVLWMCVSAGMSLPCQATQAASLPVDTDGQCKLWVDAMLKQLSQDEQLSQLVVAVVPVQADRSVKKSVRDLVKKHKIGGFCFKGGTAEDHAILINQALKDTKVPLLFLPAGKRLADGLPTAPAFPAENALRCISDPALLQAYEAEVQREYRALGMADSCLLPDKATQAKLLDAVTVTGTPLTELANLREALNTGKLSAAELEDRCRRVLTYKYLVGLRTPQPMLKVSGISHRVNPDEAKALAAHLRQATVTVAGNYFGILPLAKVDGGVAVLSIGEAGKDSSFIKALQKYTDVTHLQLATDAGNAACAETGNRLQPFRRIIIDITETGGYAFIGQEVAEFLNTLEVKAPVVYVVFAPQRSLLLLDPAIAKANALVLAHSSDADLQQYVADVLFAKAPAHGRLAENVGRAFPAGTGCDIVQGMQPGKLIPEDYGFKSYLLSRVDNVAQNGVVQGAYPGCRILILKDGKAIYDKGFGTHSDTDTAAVRSTDLFDLADLTKPMATTLAVMKLYETGKLGLDDKASAYVPALRGSDKRDITVRELLLQESGLAPHLRFHIDAIEARSVHGPYAQSWVDEWHKTQISEHSYFCSDFKFKNGLASPQQTGKHTLQVADGLWLNQSFKSTMLQSIAKSDLSGKRFVESDPGYIVLQQVVEAAAGMPLDLYAAKEFYDPMGLQRTLFRPLQKFGKKEIMPTACNDYLRKQDLCGYVYNEAAACLGGVGGNAGLFSTAEEVGKVFQMLLNGGEWDGKRFLSQETCQMFTGQTSAISRHSLGFDRPDTTSAVGSPCPASTPAAVFGYQGDTGTCVWADPKDNLVFVFLSNSLCPHAWNTKLTDMRITKEIQELIYQSLGNGE